MSRHTPGTGRFLNENGLVNEIFEDAGEVSFDIFEAATWAGNYEDGRAYAALITRAVNCHAGLVKALEEMLIAHATDIEDTYDYDPRLDAVDNTRTALAAAKGEQP